MVVESGVQSGLGFTDVLLRTFLTSDKVNNPAHFVVNMRIDGERLVSDGAAEFLSFSDEVSQGAFACRTFGEAVCFFFMISRILEFGGN